MGALSTSRPARPPNFHPNLPHKLRQKRTGLSTTGRESTRRRLLLERRYDYCVPPPRSELAVSRRISSRQNAPRDWERWRQSVRQQSESVQRPPSPLKEPGE